MIFLQTKQYLLVNKCKPQNQINLLEKNSFKWPVRQYPYPNPYACSKQNTKKKKRREKI